jgi:hypothetical protein
VLCYDSFGSRRDFIHLYPGIGSFERRKRVRYTLHSGFYYIGRGKAVEQGIVHPGYCFIEHCFREVYDIFAICDRYEVVRVAPFVTVQGVRKAIGFGQAQRPFASYTEYDPPRYGWRKRPSF